MRLLHLVLILMGLYYVANIAYDHFPEGMISRRAYTQHDGKKTASCYVFVGSITGRHRFTSCGTVQQS